MWSRTGPTDERVPRGRTEGQAKSPHVPKEKARKRINITADDLPFQCDVTTRDLSSPNASCEIGPLESQGGRRAKKPTR